MNSVGQGVREIRARDPSGAYRVVYVATFAEAIYVLHAFQKKSQRTSRNDLSLAEARFRDLKRSTAR
jgi:phage-related protein